MRELAARAVGTSSRRRQADSLSPAGAQHAPVGRLDVQQPARCVHPTLSTRPGYATSALRGTSRMLDARPLRPSRSREIGWRTRAIPARWSADSFALMNRKYRPRGTSSSWAETAFGSYGAPKVVLRRMMRRPRPRVSMCSAAFRTPRSAVGCQNPAHAGELRLSVSGRPVSCVWHRCRRLESAADCQGIHADRDTLSGARGRCYSQSVERVGVEVGGRPPLTPCSS